MTRPRCKKRIGFCPPCLGFRPTGGKAVSGEPVVMSQAETESLRLKNVEDLDQTTAAKRMGVSQSTFQRLLASAYKKVSQALVEARELRIAEE